MNTLRKFNHELFGEVRTMTNEQGETFYNGKAKVCLEVAPGDTVYFYIDKRGKKIEE